MTIIHNSVILIRLKQPKKSTVAQLRIELGEASCHFSRRVEATFEVT